MFVVKATVGGERSQVNAQVSQISIIGCTLSIINQSAVVDAKTKRLISVQPVAIKTTSEWRIWEPLSAPNNSGMVFLDPQIDGVSGTGDQRLS
jgi:hypothetical protein